MSERSTLFYSATCLTVPHLHWPVHLARQRSDLHIELQRLQSELNNVLKTRSSINRVTAIALHIDRGGLATNKLLCARIAIWPGGGRFRKEVGESDVKIEDATAT